MQIVNDQLTMLRVSFGVKSMTFAGALTFYGFNNFGLLNLHLTI